MKITGTSSYLRIDDFDGKSMVIEGELVVNGFVAYKDTMTQWEEPNRHLPVTDEDREKIVQAVIEETRNNGFTIEFE